MLYAQLIDLIKTESKTDESDFEKATNKIKGVIFSLNKEQLFPLVKEIGAIPENIDHDSTEEKLYAKTSDIILAKCFHELGLHADITRERANCADIVAKSPIHGYTLVGDAKAFRLSRTAKNQKDFKVKSMVDWKGDNDYAVIACPYYQYPNSHSQIYGQALDGNVCLFSWEHFAYFLKYNIRESRKLNLSFIWNLSAELSKSVTIGNKYDSFHVLGNELICKHIKTAPNTLIDYLHESKQIVISRGTDEIEYWNTIITQIQLYTKDQAITELITAMKINEKISAITKYIKRLTAAS
ncbi:HindIII family type II restriction endonuclease [Candidatus Magnetominusculus xianensis]|uniref:Type III restriction enzyme HindIII n=1 Tax=Candidatus Magnetominusculus xianensis TaxID=1748249 RepID=A0ABR5SD27_9BACT|nr:HindIII family type II restriction endonuclease [Candidatus Magnetominusculus xianensis]KWT82638.1 type III restriction enzyme HindIII [Candidatus Magnetominusculus xianensis]MBF0405287.1 HindIII family type II restriction endonuclease [Nitrospirota bacterium]